MLPPARSGHAAFWLLLLGTLLATGAPMFTNDAFWHVATGAYLIEVGGFPTQDPFSFSAKDQLWVLHEWLTQVLFYGVHEAAGMNGLRVLTALVSGAVLLVLWRFARRELGSTVAAAVIVGLFLMLGCWRFQTRPTLFTILAIVALVQRLTVKRPFGWSDALFVGLLQLVWTNLHSVALVGIVLQCAHGSGRLLDAYLRRRGAVAMEHATRPDLIARTGALLLSVAASFCTPAGSHLWAFAFQDKSNVMQYVDDEWGKFSLIYGNNSALTVETYVGVLIGLLVVAVTYVTVGLALNGVKDRLRHPALPEPSRVLLMLALIVGGLSARRFHWFLAVAVVLALPMATACFRAGCFSALERRLLATSVRRTAAAVGVILAVGIAWTVPRVGIRPALAAAGQSAYWNRPISKVFDLPGVRFMKEHGLEGNVVTHYGTGGILSYHLYPQVKVFIDSRIDLYRRGIYLDYLAVRSSRGDQQQILDRYGADIYYKHWELSPPVDPSAWLRVWTDGREAIYLRKGATRTHMNDLRAAGWSASPR